MSPRREWPAELLQALRDGMSVTEAARRWGISGTTLTVLRRSMGLAPRNRRPAARVARDQEIAAAYRAGAEVGDLVERYALTRNSIYAIVRAEGVPVRQLTPQQRHERDARIAAAYAGGATIVELATEYRLSDIWIRQILQAAGLFAPRRLSAPRSPRPAVAALAARVIALHDGGRRQSEIARIVGRSETRVSQIIRDEQARRARAAERATETPRPGTATPCRIPGCERYAIAKGLCRLHYGRQHDGAPLEPERGDGGFGIWGQITDDGDKLLCHECGRWYQGLGTHIALAHDMTARDYKLAYGLPLTKGLVGPGLREVQQRHAQEKVQSPHWQHLVANRDPAAAAAARDPEILTRAARLRDPEYPRRVARALAKHEVRTCVICGAQWCPLPGSGRYHVTLCGSPECKSEHSRRTAPRAVKRTGDRDRQVLEMIDAGATRAEAAARFGVSPSMIGYIIRHRQ